MCINDALTAYYKDQLWKARERGKDKGYKFIWTKNSKILVKKDENPRVLKIDIEKDLNKIVQISNYVQL